MDMQQQTTQPASAGFFSPGIPESDHPESEQTPEQTSEFTIDCDEIEDAIKDEMDDRQELDMDRVLEVGNELLFGEKTHYQLMDGLKDSKNIAADLGNGAANVMALLIHNGGHTMPGDIILPAGFILMARAAEFINESGMTPITDDDFEEASHIFQTKIINTYDPEFREKVKQYGGQQEQQPDAAAEDSAQQGPMAAPQGGGLLNQQAGV